jgi:hypothetical protein
MSKFQKALVFFLKLAAEQREYEGKTKNYVVEKKEDAPKGAKYRRKVVYDKNGYKHVLTLAKVGDKWVVTSVWHPKDEPHAAKVRSKLKEL